jgi:hypothetical protein
MPGEYMTLGEAADFLEISRATLWRRIREEGIEIYQSAQDKRVRLVRRSNVEEMTQPRPIVHTPAGMPLKTAA